MNNRVMVMVVLISMGVFAAAMGTEKGRRPERLYSAEPPSLIHFQYITMNTLFL